MRQCNSLLILKELDVKNFSDTSKSEWTFLAKNQLKGEDPNRALNWKIDGAIEIGAYHDASDLDDLEELTKFFKNLKPFNWKLYEEIAVDNEKLANEKAVEALQGGCDGIMFHVKKEAVNFDVVLQNIQMDICDISVISQENQINEVELKNKLSGFILSKKNNTVYTCTSESQIDSITDTIDSLDSEQHIFRIATNDFFLEIASLRALRFLIYDQLKKDPFSIQIHTSTALHPQQDHQWFLNATAGLASILGSTNSIMFSTASGSSRISRNVGNLIREESGISQYAGQCNGSYYIEVLTHKIIQACKSRLNTK